ncbi:MAG: GerMN domain-containing protein [Spirochaetes bacterium]|jgi:spore germination protein GerM|nr:GerMN domain-containing protein [Spirochaetota bacterium]
MAQAAKGKKKPAGKKTGSGTAKKKTAGTASKKTGAVRASAAAEIPQRKDRSPIYILAIMALLCIIVVLLNKYYFAEKKEGASAGKTVAEDTAKKEDSSGPAQKTVKEEKGDEKKTAEINVSKSEETDKTEKNKSDVMIYLISYNAKTDKMSLLPMKRRVESETPVKGALNELLKGPSKNEERRGLLTAMPENLKIRDIKIENNTAVIDFNGAIEDNANGNILLMRVDQIVYTATQFKNIDSVLIKINGKRKSFLGSDGLSIGGPITRRK